MTTISGIIRHPSPNAGVRRGGVLPDMVVLHYTAMQTAEAAVERLCDPQAEVSAHYVIAEDGRTWALVDEEARAWHAGVSSWGRETDVNSRSIGIELANRGHEMGYPPFPEPQMRALEALLGGILGRWRIAPERVVGHADVAPGRKIDPGEKFDWRRLARQGLSVWVDFEAGDPDRALVADLRRAARRIGYPVPDGDDWDEATLAVWHSFAMRFVPALANGPPRKDAVAHAARIAARWPVLDPDGAAT